MKKILLLINVYIISMAYLQAQSKQIQIDGKILNSNGKAASNVMITIKETNAVTYSDQNGSFSIQSPKGNIILIVNAGASAEKIQINVDANTDKQLAPIYIKEKHYELEEVVITGQYEPQSLKKAVYKVRSINAEKIRLRAPSNLQQVLNTEFGFRFNNDLTLGVSNVEMMGMSGRNVKILLDGVPLVDRSELKESLNQVDINTVERIEIVEGPMSVEYGTDALAGVINIISKGKSGHKLDITTRIQEESAGSEYEALIGKGSHHKNINLNWQDNGWNITTGFSNNTFGGWNLLPKTATKQQVDAVTNKWKPKNQYLGNVKLGYHNSKINIWYRGDYLNEHITTRGGINPNYTVVTSNYITDRLNNQLHANWHINQKINLTTVGAYTNLQRKTVTKVYDFTTSTEKLTNGPGEQDVAKFNSALMRTTLQYKLSDLVALQPGIEINRENASGQRIKGIPNITDYAIFASGEVKLFNILKLRPGIRFTHNSIYDAPVAIPSLNTLLQINNHFEFRLGYGKGFRAPALRELYFDFVDASHSILGNENLKAEKSASFDGSFAWTAVRKQHLKFTSTLAGFYNRFYDRIEYGQDAHNPSITTLINISKYKTTGVSIDNNLAYNNMQLQFGLAFIGRYNELTEGNYQQFVPPFSWSSELFGNLIYTFRKLKGTLNLSCKFAGSRPSYQINNNTPSAVQLIRTGSFTWADLLFNKTFNKYLTLHTGIKNLFDVTELNNTSAATGGAHSSGGGTVPYSYGRSYVLGLVFSWSKR